MNFSICSRSAFFLGASLLLLQVFPASASQPAIQPDTVVLTDGSTLRGLIIQNTVDSVILVNNGDEQRIPKSKIARIRDEDDGSAVAIAALKPGQLPSSRLISNDLRTHDDIRSVIQIPPMRVEKGVFAFIPYKSFMVNQSLELNIYGDPENPVGIEFGIYDLSRSSMEHRQQVRNYMAGFLTSRAALNALYSLDLDGGKARAGKLTIEVTPPDAPDAFGSWWLSFYRDDELAAYRLSPEEYAAATIEPDAFDRSRGRHRSNSPIDFLLGQTKFLWREGGKIPNQVLDWTGDTTDTFLGFFRDENGRLKLIPFLPDSDEDS